MAFNRIKRITYLYAITQNLKHFKSCNTHFTSLLYYNIIIACDDELLIKTLKICIVLLY